MIERHPWYNRICEKNHFFESCNDKTTADLHTREKRKIKLDSVRGQQGFESTGGQETKTGSVLQTIILQTIIFQDGNI